MKKSILLFLITAIIAGILGIKTAPVFYLYSSSVKDTRMPKEELFNFVNENQIPLENAVTFISQFEKEYPNVKTFERDETGAIVATGFGQPIQISHQSICQLFKEQKLRSITVSENYLDFYCGGYGLGSATGYTGFYYTRSGRIEDFDHVGKTKFEYNGSTQWTYKEPNGDNTVLIEFITGDFFYYSAEF